MLPHRVKFTDLYKSSIVELKGGVNENVSSLELLAGELTDCKNYMLAEGGYGGYVSTAGYEAFDGLTTPSIYKSTVITITTTSSITVGDIITGDTSGATVLSLETVNPVDGEVTVQCLLGAGELENSENLSGPLGSLGPLVTQIPITGGTPEYNLAIENARATVMEVPGEGGVLGVHIFEGSVYAFRKAVGTDQIGMYVTDPITGWSEIDTSADPLVYTGDHDFYFTNYNFKAGTDSYAMYWCDGQNRARVYDGSTVVTISNSGMDPNDKPVRILGHNYHLWLAYTGGSLQYSQIGEPDSWDGALGAGEIGVGDEITSIETGVSSSLVITLRTGIRILTGSIEDDFVLQVFSKNSGAISKTTQRLLGTIYFIDDRGLSTLDAVQDYGDYSANSISQRFKRTLLDPDHSITCTTTSRDLNQYRIFFDDRKAIYVSFEGVEFKGATFIEFERTVDSVAHGDIDGKDYNVFISGDSGYVYLMDSGTSFNGNPIICRMSTAFFHYGSPRTWKTFKRATVEVSGDQGQTFDMKVDFDYNEAGLPATIWYTPEIYSTLSSSTYSVDKWGEMVYGASTVANRAPVYLQGFGTNMSYKFLSNETYRPQHIIQNIITDYEVLSRRV